MLGDIAKTFNVSEISVGYAAMLTQLGYAVGMIFILPLGDIKERRNLITVMLGFSIVALTSMFFSHNIFMLIISSFAVGFTSIVPQLIIPLAAQLSNPNERGRIIGTVMSGLLIGILASRTFSGILGGYLGWRIVYIIAAIMIIILMVALRKLIPICKPVSNTKYFELLKSMIQLIKTESVLREASINGAMMFASFSAFWTSLIFLLDLGVQSGNVSNQTRVHSLNEEMRNRINTVYMVSYFLGGAFGSFLGSYSYAHFGWYGVCIFGITTQIVAVIVHRAAK